LMFRKSVPRTLSRGWSLWWGYLLSPRSRFPPGPPPALRVSTNRRPSHRRASEHPAANLLRPLFLEPRTAANLLTPTSAGYPTSYIQWHTCLSQNFAAHTVSLVCDGVFQKFPRLKFVLIEGGVSWLAPLMWRLDKNYKALRSEVPWLTRLPSEYIKEHVRLTTQPIEEPADPRDLLRIFEIIDAERTLMYSSDYPHGGCRFPNSVDIALSWREQLGDETFAKIANGNARRFLRM